MTVFLKCDGFGAIEVRYAIQILHTLKAKVLENIYIFKLFELYNLLVERLYHKICFVLGYVSRQGSKVRFHRVCVINLKIPSGLRRPRKLLYTYLKGKAQQLLYHICFWYEGERFYIVRKMHFIGFL